MIKGNGLQLRSDIEAISDARDWVKLAVARSASTDIEVLRMLATDPDPLVRREALNNSAYNDGDEISFDDI